MQMQNTPPDDRSDHKKATNRALWSWSFYDWANQSYATVIQTFVFAAYFTQQVATDTERATTHWSLTIGLTGLCVAVSGPFLGAIADRAGRRKPWILVNTLICVFATAGLWFVYPQMDDYRLALGLLAVATFGIQTAGIFYNAMLADLAMPQEYGRWSGRGWALGYVGGICCLVAVLFLFVQEGALLPLDRTTAAHVRAVFPFVSLWLVVFALPLFFLTPDRHASGNRLRQSIREGIGQLHDSLRNIREHKELVRFLIAWAICTDGLATIFALGGVYAAGTFGMDETRILLFGIALSLTAGAGAFGFSWVDERIGSRKTILLGLVGLFIFSTLILVVTDNVWFWTYGLLLGVFVGPVQASSRSYLSHVAPEAMRGQLFGVYALAGKSTSFLGPLLVGGLTAVFDSQRLGLAIIPVYFLVGWLIMRGIPEKKSV
ncbi:MAG: MFS transporter [Pelovirga sp.]